MVSDLTDEGVPVQLYFYVDRDGVHHMQIGTLPRPTRFPFEIGDDFFLYETTPHRIEIWMRERGPYIATSDYGDSEQFIVGWASFSRGWYLGIPLVFEEGAYGRRMRIIGGLEAWKEHIRTLSPPLETPTW